MSNRRERYIEHEANPSVRMILGEVAAGRMCYVFYFDPLHGTKHGDQYYQLGAFTDEEIEKRLALERKWRSDRVVRVEVTPEQAATGNPDFMRYPNGDYRPYTFQR